MALLTFVLTSTETTLPCYFAYTHTSVSGSLTACLHLFSVGASQQTMNHVKMKANLAAITA